MALTDLKIRRDAKPRDKEFKLFDGEGLFLLVKPNGKKYWKWKYKFLNREKKLSIGKYPEISLKEARSKRFEASLLLQQGIDPNAHKKEQKNKALAELENSFYKVATEWFEAKKQKVSSQHATKLWRGLERHIFPLLSKRPIHEIDTKEVLTCIQKIEDQGKTEISRKLFQVCDQIFKYAYVTGRTKHNPTYGLKDFLKKHQSKHYPCIPIEEIPAFLEKLDSMNTSPQNKIATRILMYTFVRTGEMRQSKWEYIDWENRMWLIPAEIMKMREPHKVPLSNQVIQQLKELKKITRHCPQGYMFPSHNRQKNPIMSENTINQLIAKMGYKGRMVGHGFRSLASTNLHEQGYTHDAIERQLSHQERNTVVRSYNHAEHMPERIRMMQEWADHLDSLGGQS